VKVLSTARIAVDALWVNKTRSGLSILGIVIGVAAVITMISVGAGARAQVAEQVVSLGRNQIITWAASGQVAGARLGAGTRPSVTEEDAWAIQREVDAVEAAAPIVWGRVPVVYGNENWQTVMLGVTPEYLPVREWDVVAGRPITHEEVDGAAKVAMVGLTVAGRLFGSQDPVGQVVRIKRVPFTVVGILGQKGQTTWGQDQDDQILVPLTTAKRKILGRSPAGTGAVGSVSLKVREGVPMDIALDEVRRVLRQRHRLGPDQDDDFVLQNLTEVLETHESSSQTLTRLLAAIASISLVVGGVGIMNIMLVSVTERTREIGLRMAVGARGRDISIQFLVEALTLALLGGVGGLVLGVIVTWAVSWFVQWRVLLQPEALLLALAFAAAVGVCSGLYPARRAAAVHPIEALRHE
jgi:putative ABC transport system permease protein